jgi:hypothetical protein
LSPGLEIINFAFNSKRSKYEFEYLDKVKTTFKKNTVSYAIGACGAGSSFRKN